MSFMMPWGLLLGLLAGPLIALYFLRIRRRRIRVPSLLLWHAMRQSEQLATPFERFRRNLLLFVQLLALLLLTLAFARPYLETEKSPYRSVVIVLDTSASMAATDVAPNRFAVARGQAREIVDGIGPADEVLLVSAGPRTRVEVPFTRDLEQVRSALGQITVSEGEGSLREALQLAFSLARSRPDVEVVVLSDGGGEDLTTVPTGGTPSRYVMVGAKDDNAGIIALDLRRNPVSELDQQLFVTVQNYGSRSTQGSVELYLEGKLVAVRNEALPRATPVSMVFDLPTGSEGALEVRLDVPGDQLPSDDRAYAWVEDAASRDVLIVGGDALTLRALKADPRITLDRMSPSAVTREVLENYDAILFAGTVPDDVDGLSYAVLGPDLGGPVAFGPEVKAPGVLSWRRTHPTQRFVSWDGVTIARSRAVDDAGGLSPWVEGTDGPLVLGGERAGGRVLVLAFDPLQSDLPLRVAWPVLLMNTVGWLTEDAAGAVASTTIPAGRTWVRRVPTEVESVSVQGPDGAVEANLGEGLLRVADTTSVGFYEVTGELQTTFAANLLSQRESNIAPRGSLGLEAGEERVAAAAVAAGRREIWRPLLIAALLVLLLEWALWNRRRTA